jgi:hypothetical protein
LNSEVKAKTTVEVRFRVVIRVKVCRRAQVRVFAKRMFGDPR